MLVLYSFHPLLSFPLPLSFVTHQLLFSYASFSTPPSHHHPHVHRVPRLPREHGELCRPLSDGGVCCVRAGRVDECRPPPRRAARVRTRTPRAAPRPRGGRVGAHHRRGAQLPGSTRTRNSRPATGSDRTEDENGADGTLWPSDAVECGKYQWTFYNSPFSFSFFLSLSLHFQSVIPFSTHYLQPNIHIMHHHL